MIRLAVAGAAGRMGRRVLDLALGDERFAVAAALTEPGCPTAGSTIRIGGKDVAIVDRLTASCDVLVDFTVAAGTMALLQVCTERKLPMVIGATGHTEEQLGVIREAARMIPILKSANFSVGVNVLLGMVGRLATALGADYDVEIVETHHREKIDAPSGTALAFVDEIRDAAEPGARESVVFGRAGQVGKRPKAQIGVHAIRMGDLVSRHEIHFGGPGETVTLQHTAHSRDTFAAGALRAAAWIVGRQAAFYTMGDVTA